MSKKSKKQREQARKAEVRRISGVTLRAVTPPSAGGKVLELKRPESVKEPAAEPVRDEAPASAPVRDEAPVAEPVRDEAPVAEPVHAEQRTSPRTSVAVHIHLWSDSHFFSGLSGDISEGGLFLSTYRPLSIGMRVDVEFSLPWAERTIHARGEVRWIREHSAELPRGVGISFEELGEEDRDAIHSFCSSRPALYYEDLG